LHTAFGVVGKHSVSFKLFRCIQR